MNEPIRKIFTFPLFTVCVIGCITHPSWYWCYALALLYVLNIIFFFTSALFFSATQLKDFRNEFIKNNKFTLHPIALNSVEIDWRRDFSNLLLSYKAGKKKKVGTLPDFDFLQTPLLLFYAEPNADYIFGACKAYMHSLGKFVIVCRTNDIKKNYFETFIYLHEMEHINDNGLLSYRSLTRYRLRFFLHVFLLAAILSGPFSIALFGIYILMGTITFFVLSEGKKESAADLGALLHMSKDDQTKAIILLRKLFMQETKQKKFYKRIVAKERLKALNFFETSGILDIDIDPKEKPLMAQIAKYRPMLIESFVSFIYIVVSFWKHPIAPQQMTSNVILFSVVYLFIFLVICLRAFQNSTELYKYLSENFTPSQFNMPFDVEDLKWYSPKAAAKLKFGDIDIKDGN
jgi:hypothetical protein